jgi:hypothetical protein
LKVLRQVSNESILKNLTKLSFYKKIWKGTVTFPPLVGCVGAA